MVSNGDPEIFSISSDSSLTKELNYSNSSPGRKTFFINIDDKDEYYDRDYPDQMDQLYRVEFDYPFQSDSYFSVTSSDTTLVNPTINSASVDQSRKSISLSWLPVYGASSYEVTRCLDQYLFESCSKITTTNKNTTSILITDGTPGTDYYFRVKACDLYCSGYSNYSIGRKKLVLPKAISILSASQGDYEDKIDVKWEATDTADYYELYYCWSEFNINQCGPVGGNPLKRNNYSLKAGNVNQIYYLRVKSCNDHSCSELSKAFPGFKKSIEELKEKTPKQSLSGIATSGGKSSKATIEGGATSDVGKTSKATFTAGDYIDVVFTVYPEEGHIGETGYIYVVLSKTNGKRKLSHI